MARTCPDGHLSQSEDYCDTCGLAMAADASGAEQAGSADPDATFPDLAPVQGASQECPNCHAQGPVDALFCEACGYDYTTGTMPRPVEPPAFPLPGSLADAEAADDLEAPSAESVAPTPSSATPSSATPAAPAQSPATPSRTTLSAVATPPGVNPSPGLDEPWVAEVWIDPDWYADQGSSDPMPSPGMPTVVLLRHTSSLVGRTSRSRGIVPHIDISGDPGVSRRHAQLTTDGSRWFVEDLGSANGTFVAPATGSLPTEPIPAGQRREIASGEQVYVGAWTRIVVRRAAEGEH